MLVGKTVKNRCMELSFAPKMLGQTRCYLIPILLYPHHTTIDIPLYIYYSHYNPMIYLIHIPLYIH